MLSDLEPQLREDSPLYHDAFRISIKTPSFYRHDVFLVDEDDDVEFKGHLAFSYEQLPVKAKRLQTKRHISSVANGMLNNEKGGIILMESTTTNVLKVSPFRERNNSTSS